MGIEGHFPDLVSVYYAALTLKCNLDKHNLLLLPRTNDARYDGTAIKEY